MSTIAAISGQTASQRTRIWLQSLLVLGVVTMIVTVAAFFVNRQSTWVEIIGNDLLRTNASTATIAAASQAVIDSHRNWIDAGNGKRSDPSYHSGLNSWWTGPSREEARIKVAQARTQITDKNGKTVAIKSLSATDTPTLVFIEHEEANERQVLLNEFVTALRSSGVTVRHN